MDVDSAGVGANPTRLTNDVEAENYPSWSPDGKRLVYQRDLDGSAIYVINADGTGQQRLSPTPGLDVTPSWSPDGSSIVYVRLLEAPQTNMPPMTDIRIMDVDGTGRSRGPGEYRLQRRAQVVGRQSTGVHEQYEQQ